mgnify:FL=1|jgi:predicted kinase
MDYYEVIVAVVTGVSKSGKDTVVKENYLVDAMSVTEAEARVVDDFTKAKTQLDYNVVSAKESRIMRVISK